MVIDFAKIIQNKTPIFQTLNKFYQTSQVIEVKDFSHLEGFIKDIYK